ncbi:MAG: PAS domain S-box protein, partial [Planctomycetes bacterium]|nr:PAS domain S-box protein [Planctomycetota bacterium]
MNMKATVPNQDVLVAVQDATGDSVIALKAIREGSPHPKDFQVLFVNESTGHRLPFPITVGDLFFQSVAPLAESGLHQLCQRVLQSGQPERMTLSFSHDNVPIEVEACVGALGDGVVIACRDCSQVERMRTSIKEGRDFQQAILDTIDVAIVLADQTGKILAINPMVTRLLGYQSEELLGRNVRDLSPPEIAVEHDTYIRRYLQTGDAQIIGVGREVEAITKAGKRIPVRLQIS